MPADAIETREGNTPDTFVMTLDSAASMDGSIAAQHAGGTITLRLRDIDRVAAIRAALEAAGADNVALPIYSLTERSAARREAQARALAAARVDAESYAAHAGMRLARVVRISERVGGDLYGIALNNEALFRGLQGSVSPGQPQTEPEIVTLVMLGVDYALAPR